MVGSSLNSRTLTLKSIKFVCSYGGRILPRYPDGKLRYHGGETRVLAVNSSVSFNELLQKMGEMCGSSVTLRCQFPTEDLDALVSITSDQDLTYLIEEYRAAAAAVAPPPSSIKIRAFLSAPKLVSPSTSAVASFSPKSPFEFAATGGGRPPRCPTAVPPPPDDASGGLPGRRCTPLLVGSLPEKLVINMGIIINIIMYMGMVAVCI